MIGKPSVSAGFTRIGSPATGVGQSEGGISWSSYWTTRKPSNLVVLTNLATEIILTWDDALNAADGLRIYISTDNINFTEKGTANFGDETFTASGLTPETDYYFRLVAYKGTHESDALTGSNTTKVTFNKGKVVFTFDCHGAESIYTNGYPLFVSKGIAVTMYLLTTPTIPDIWVQHLEMVNAGVVDLECHSDTHAYFNALSEAQIDAELEAVNAAFVAHGLATPKHHAYPGGLYNLACKPFVNDYRLTAATVDSKPYYPTYRDYDKLSLRRTSIDNIGQAGYLYGGTDGINVIKGYMDAVETNKTVIILYAHYVVTTGSTSNKIDVADLTTLIDYAQTLDVDIITIPELYDLMFQGTTVETATDDFVLTSTGTGVGVSTLRITTLQDITVTLDGTAKFYSDAAGTLDESSTWDALMGYQIRYIKCPSGTANLKFPKGCVVRFNEWTSGTNAASLGGDITQFTNLDYLYCLGNNTLSGDLSSMIDLTLVYLKGTNTISATITNLVNLTTFRVEAGSGTISGSIAGLTKMVVFNVSVTSNLSGSIEGLTALTTFTATGTNTITGSIVGLTSLTYLYVLGSNTISGDISGMTGLTWLYVTGSNTLSGSFDALISLTWLYVTGSNTISGDPALISDGITWLQLSPCRIVNYTGSGNWLSLSAQSNVYINASVGYGLSSAEVDQLIIDIEATRAADRHLHITLIGANAARTSASDAAVAAIIADGGAVTTNP